MFKLLQKFHRIIAVALVGIVLSTSLFNPEPAHAQLAVGVVESLPDKVNKIETSIGAVLKQAGINAVVRMVGYAIRKMSYDAAVWVASGGKGQQPLAQTEGNVGKYLLSVGDEAAGAAIEKFTKDAFGFGICRPPDIKADLVIKVGLRTNFLTTSAPLKPTCSATQFASNWKSQMYTSVYGSKGLIKDFNAGLRVDDSPLGIYAQATERINQAVYNEKVGAAIGRSQSDYLPSVSPVSGQVKTPASTVEEVARANTPDKQQKRDQDQLNALLANGDVKVIPAALSLFINNLVSQMAKNWQEKGMLPFGLCIGDTGGEACKNQGSNGNGSGNSALSADSGGSRSNAELARSLFSDFLTAKVSSKDNYTNDLLSALSSCPDNAGVYNCRMSEDFVEAVRSAETGEPLTVAKAIQMGKLSGNWKLIPPGDKDGNEHPLNKDKKCFEKAFCYHDVKVLRQLRILPLGFEIAAQKSNSDNPVTLAKAVEYYDKCDDPDYGKFCHLIDPNWVLKAPPSKCNALGYTSQLLDSGVAERLQECVDIQTCVSYDENGNCANYAYCTREKSTWGFSADTCQPHNATCRAFQNANGQTVAYLYRTLDTNYCTQDTVGCRAYSLTQNANGQWATPSISNQGANTAIFFNGTLPQTCSANSDGCSRFIATDEDNTPLNLRKAPEYLGCYDTDQQTPGIQWPKTVSDLNRVSKNPMCEQYASVCIPDEVGCNFYTPSAGGDRIPGRFTQADQCDQRCVGYDAYREMPTQYSVGESVAYIIPSSGQTCTAQESGCTAFTNLSSQTGAQEQIEHFSYLRACVKPNEGLSKVFVTYEGSRESGYQLKTYRLLVDENGETGVAGSPKYFYKNADELSELLNVCDATSYKNGTADLDCREFTDEDGKLSYRLLAHTIPVSNECTNYRVNKPELYVEASYTTQATCPGVWENGSCKVCVQNGEYKDGSCFYKGLPGGITNTAGVSRTCSTQAETCRPYKGNAGNNVKTVFVDGFESSSTTEALSGWSSARLSSESTRVGEHSIENNNGSALVKTLELKKGESYEVSFWAKSSGGALTVEVSGPAGYKYTAGRVAVNDTWGLYRVGPFEYTGDTANASVAFRPTEANARIFMDNVRMVRVEDYLYLVKKTLKVDPVCDSIQSDNLPGEALGCKAYRDPNNTEFYLTNFSTLCREKAVGCTAMLDTYNTLDTKQASIYNAWFPGTPGRVALKNDGTINCTIETGRTGCYVKQPIIGMTPAELAQVELTSGQAPRFVSSSVYVPADTTTSSPLYLVANRAATCNEVDLGCTNVGVLTQTPAGAQFTTQTIKNDPKLYQSTLCQNEAVGCGAYTDGNDTRYFKDPAVTGQKICEYKPSVRVNGVETKGWFWKGTGTCSNNAQNNCTKDADCGQGNTCQNIGSTPCYPTYLDGNEYGLWSLGNTGRYDNFVGECPVSENRCTQYVDRTDNKSYFVKKNERLTTAAAECGGNVNRKEGCAVFDDTSNPEKLYDTAALYVANDKTGQRVSPVDSNITQTKKDANTILKVQPNRECGEWLQCLHSTPVYDPQTGYRNICQDLTRCRQGDSAETCGAGVKSAHPGQVLTEEVYKNRVLGWSGMDFSGYSILGIYPIEELDSVRFSKSEDVKQDWRLAKYVPCAGVNCAVGTSPTNPVNFTCEKNNEVCGTNGKGLCINNACIRTIDGKNDIQQVRASAKQICRAYPESASPFPNVRSVKSSNSFAQANLCSESVQSELLTPFGYCECDYTKVNYGDSITKYFDYQNPNSVEPKIGDQTGLPAGICQGGSRDGMACSNNLECHQLVAKEKVSQDDYKAALQKGSVRNAAVVTQLVAVENGAEFREPIIDGVCQPLKEKRSMLGWRGYCLEEDAKSVRYGNVEQRACLTWFPVDQLEGAPDIYNQHVDAGYVNPSVGGRFYCLNSNGGADQGGSYQGESSSIYFSTAGLANPILGQSEVYEAPKYDYGYGTPVMSQLVVPKCNDYDGKDSDGDGQDKEAKDADVCNVSCGWFETCAGIRTWDKPIFNRTAFVPTSTLYSLSDIERIKIQIDNKDYYIFPHDSGMSLGQPQSFYTLKYDKVYNPMTRQPGEAIVEKVAVGMYMGRPNEWLMIRTYNDPDTTLDENGNFIYKRRTFNSNNPPERETMIKGNLFGDDTNPLTVMNGAVSLSAEGLWDANVGNEFFCGKNSENPGWTAIRFKFDPITGKLDKIYTALCGNGPDEITYNISYEKREWCRFVADATVDPANDVVGTATHTAAWTDRLWRGSYTVPTLNYKAATPQAPYGSLAGPAVDNIYGSSKEVVISKRADSPCQANPSPGYTMTCKFTLSPDSNSSNVGAPYSCGDGSSDVRCQRNEGNNKWTSTNAHQVSRDQAADLFENIFAKVASVYHYNNGAYRSNLAYTGKIDATSKGKSPSVLSLAACTGTDRKCVEGVKNSFVINNVANKDIAVFTNTFKATAKFFAYADPEQMPIRRIVIDWNDIDAGESRYSKIEGYLRNKRGVVQPTCNKQTNTCSNSVQTCTRDEECDRQSICTEERNASNFGLISGRTCDTDYFELTNTALYCSKSSTNYFPAGSAECRNTAGVEYPGGCCVFKPKLQVMDNWGWCTGSCSGKEGCYLQSTMADQCDYKKYNSNIRGYTNTSGAQTIWPWIEFSGRILLAPEE